MQYVEIYKLDNNGNQHLIVVCKLIDGKSFCEGDKIFVKNLAETGINEYGVQPPIKLFPSDGGKFLSNLKYAFKSGYLIATDVKVKEDDAV